MEEADVLRVLDEEGIPYERTAHPAVYTIAEMEEAGLPYPEDVCKNLFLRDAAGKRHFLVVLAKEKKADLRRLADQLGSTKLSFASEDRLRRFLSLSAGAVTPLGILNDADRSVEVAFDADLVGRERLGMHPCVNTATLWLSYDALRGLIERRGNRLHIVTV